MEKHILEPFLPQGTKVLILGSFPPKKEKWKMDFYYPNFQNDMWRILALVFYKDKYIFIREEHKSFDKDKICQFLKDHKIGVGDSALTVNRLKDNASDKFLEVLEFLDFEKVLDQIPECDAIVTTGEKSAEIVKFFFHLPTLPKIGEGVDFLYKGRKMRFFRVPSSSRAYPKSIEDKATIYSAVFKKIFEK